MSYRDEDRLDIILELVGYLQRRLGNLTFADFAEDADERDLTAFRLGHIGENANKLSEAVKARHPHLPWQDMYRFRNLVAHEYSSINARKVWVATQDLEPIKAMCLAELAAFPKVP